MRIMSLYGIKTTSRKAFFKNHLCFNGSSPRASILVDPGEQNFLHRLKAKNLIASAGGGMHVVQIQVVASVKLSVGPTSSP